jgi:hypothetical protein
MTGISAAIGAILGQKKEKNMKHLDEMVINGKLYRAVEEPKEERLVLAVGPATTATGWQVCGRGTALLSYRDRLTVVTELKPGEMIVHKDDLWRAWCRHPGCGKSFNQFMDDLKNDPTVTPGPKK